MTHEEAPFVTLRQKYASHIDLPGLIECGTGWAGILDQMFHRITAAMADHGERLEIRQIKEKFGTLRVLRGALVQPSSDAVDIAICDVELLSHVTCEVCGEPGCLRVDGFDWYATRCEEHAANDSSVRRTPTPALSRWRDGRLLMRMLEPASRTITERAVSEEEWNAIVRGRLPDGN